MKKIQMKYKVLIIILIIALVLYIFFYHIAVYTSNAYVRANWVEISPRVTGHVDKVSVATNQYVKKDDPLFYIYAYPYQLELNKLKAQYSEEEEKAQTTLDNIKAVKMQIEDTERQMGVMKKQTARYDYLAKMHAESTQAYEDIVLQSNATNKELNELKGQYAVLQDTYKTHLRTLKYIDAEIKLAEYHLQQTKIIAPVEGFVTNNYLMNGQYLDAGEAVFGIAQTQNCWIEANFKECFIGKIKPGMKVWVMSDLYPFKFLTGTVQNTTHAVNRTPDKDKLLPYIKPTIDWVRLQYRFTVRIKLDNVPKDMHLRMGADARVLVWL